MSLFLIANFLPIALPPTVSEDTKELIKSVTITNEKLVLFDTKIDNIAATEPLTIPQISPITSLHILEIVLEFLTK